jgi:formate-dependent nitrite reductase membrane component NrfD
MADYTIFHHIPWGGAYAIYFFTIGLSAALFFFSALSWFREEFKPLRLKADIASFVLLLVSGALLVGDLSQPLRFLNAINPLYLNFASPLAWGALNLASFGIVSVLYIVMLKKGNEGNAKKLAVIGALLALGLPIYTGFDLTVHQNRPVWNTPLMPVLFVALSLVSGAAVASFFAAGEAKLVGVLRQIMLWSTGAVGVMLVSLLGTTSYGGVGQELTFMILTTGSMSLVFLWLGVILGTAAPIALLLAPFGRQTTGVMLSALLILVGGMALRYSILVGGQIVQTYF